MAQKLYLISNKLAKTLIPKSSHDAGFIHEYDLVIRLVGQTSMTVKMDHRYELHHGGAGITDRPKRGKRMRP